MDGLQVGNEALKKANAMFSIEEIEQIMGDTAEAIEKQQEIDALLSGQLSTEDEDEVLEELDQLCNLEAEDSSENVTPQQLPDVPTEDPSLSSSEGPKKERDQEKQKTRKTKIALEAS